MNETEAAAAAVAIAGEILKEHRVGIRVLSVVPYPSQHAGDHDCWVVRIEYFWGPEMVASIIASNSKTAIDREEATRFATAASEAELRFKNGKYESWRDIDTELLIHESKRNIT
jgi:hypothetical protein